MRHLLRLISLLALLIILIAIFSASSKASITGTSVTGATLISSKRNNDVLRTGGADIGKKITTQENVDITLVAVETKGSQVFIHLQIHNHQLGVTDLTTNSVTHRFYASRGLKEVALSPVNNDAKHPTLSAKLNAGKQADGWVTADITALGGDATVILYKIAPFHTLRCAHLPTYRGDTSTCQPATLYYGSEWIL